ncbi:MAG: hypothetical protein ACM3QW_07175 [Ignavibacteriales bacterium]
MTKSRKAIISAIATTIVIAMGFVFTYHPPFAVEDVQKIELSDGTKTVEVTDRKVILDLIGPLNRTELRLGSEGCCGGRGLTIKVYTVKENRLLYLSADECPFIYEGDQFYYELSDDDNDLLRKEIEKLGLRTMLI